MTEERKRREWRTVTEREFEDWTRPKLILFLSADIENSTRLKQSAAKSADWLPKVFSFISEFPATFQYCREVRAREAKLVPPGPLAPWKILGDEVIFSIPIFDHSQPEWETMSMAGALAKWNEEREVKVKGTAWLAGFPVANTPIPSQTPMGGQRPITSGL